MEREQFFDERASNNLDDSDDNKNKDFVSDFRPSPPKPQNLKRKSSYSDGKTERNVLKPRKLQWTSNAPVAKFEERNIVDPVTALDAFERLARATRLNDVTAKVVQPRGGDIVVYENVDKDLVRNLADMDAFKWRLKSVLRMQGDWVKYMFYSQFEIGNIHHNLFKKKAYYDGEKKRLLVHYEGDDAYAQLNEEVLRGCPSDERPPGPTKIVPLEALRGQLGGYPPTSCTSKFEKYPDNASRRVWSQPLKKI
jgi:hypothetical protein